MEERLDRIEKTLEAMAVRMDKGDEVFSKRIAALIARDEALAARDEALTAQLAALAELNERLAERHEALSQSVELLVQSLYRRGKDSSQ
jgi:hypothetical protein